MQQEAHAKEPRLEPVIEKSSRLCASHSRLGTSRTAAFNERDDYLPPHGGCRRWQAFRQDLPHAEVHLIEAGHFALDEQTDTIAEFILQFMAKVSK